jgi:hypothetical protein
MRQKGGLAMNRSAILTAVVIGILCFGLGIPVGLFLSIPLGGDYGSLKAENATLRRESKENLEFKRKVNALLERSIVKLTEYHEHLVSEHSPPHDDPDPRENGRFADRERH